MTGAIDPDPGGVVVGVLVEMDRARNRCLESGAFQFDRSLLTRVVMNRFRKEMGMSARKYLVNLRVDLAAEMLRMSGASPSVVARAVGYDSYSSFRIHFRIRHGRAPTEFRRDEFQNPLQEGR